MKKDICGVECDTTTAMPLFVWGIKSPASPEYMEETLYRTKNGEFFFHSVGGYKTMFAINIEGGWVGGKHIRLCTTEEAEDFIRTMSKNNKSLDELVHIAVEDAETDAGDEDEQDGFSLNLPYSVWQQLCQKSAIDGTDINTAIRSILMRYFA